MWTLAVDAVTAEVVTAFEAADVDAVLLKGPSIATWLYEDPALRGYADSDLLVDPDRIAAARATLTELGFRPEFGPLPHPGMESPPSQPWHREGFAVDLHETLPGVAADPRAAWRVLRSGATEQSVGRRTVRVLGEPARLAHVALHAGHHGPLAGQPLEDLRRALAVAGQDSWRSALEVAERMEATACFAAGLGLLPDGRRLLARLGVDPSAEAAGPADVPVEAGLARLRTTPGLGPKATLLRGELLPSPEFMRWWSPLARRSRRGLIAAYAWRWAYLAWHALRVWRRGDQHISRRMDVS
jgi:hypothetical protein